MSGGDADFLVQLRATFRIEAAEHLQAMTAGLLELERAPAEAQRAIVESVFRAAHSLKGAARAVDMGDIESHCESLEDTFSAWRRGSGPGGRSEIDALHQRLDRIAAALAAPPAGSPPPGSARPSAADSLPRIAGPAATTWRVPAAASRVAAVAPAATHAVPAAPPAQPPAAPVATEATVRIPVAKLNARLVKAEEMLGIKLTTGQRADDLRALHERLEIRNREWATAEADCRTLRQPRDRSDAADAARGRVLTRLLDFVDSHAREMRLLESEVGGLARAAVRDRQAVNHAIDELLVDTRQLLRLPMSTITAALRKLVYDLCREQGKHAELRIHGDEIDLDKQILEELKDPLIHLLRNAVDHGIEPPEDRRRVGKPEQATLTLAFSQRADNRLELLIADDGAGIDAQRVRQAAVEKARLSAAEAQALSDPEALALVFESELSTRVVASRVSGRGLGLAIVREKAEKLGGAVSVESRHGEGTRFRLVVPSTVATFRGVLVQAAGRAFVLPTAHVASIVRVAAGDIQTVKGRETLSLGGRPVAHVRLADVLSLPPGPPAAEAVALRTPAVVLGNGEQRIAFAVDALLGEQEVLVKRFTRPLVRLRHVAAATVLGSGEVVPILDTAGLLSSARSAGASPRVAAAAVVLPPQACSVLVVDDSITSRMLIRNVLEAAGYQVRTAVDGVDAYTLLRSEAFDLVVSDVEMPRLDGFGLTEKIRADRRLADLPVVLLTALETQHDRERGIDAGASAYLVKSGFDQAHLLATVQRLLSAPEMHSAFGSARPVAKAVS